MRFDIAGRTFLIDPYFSRIRRLKAAIGAILPDRAAVAAALPAVTSVSAIIVGHTHFDHALDVPLIAAQSGATVVGSRSLDTLMALSGLPGRTQVCRGGETVGLGPDAAVQMLPSAHGLAVMGKAPFGGEIRASGRFPMRAAGYRAGIVFAPLLRLRDRTFLHIGSANFIAAALAGRSCDVLFLCVPGWKRAEGYPGQVITLTRPQTVVLFHYDDFCAPIPPRGGPKRLPLLDMARLADRIRRHAPGIELLMPEVGARMVF
ncbi:MBL fold metallo-hydrolase [Desulfatitalea alkaliphila]|uniref:L-ascorbate metabolism protein UlaG, beta-lactamase superfamily n=1 Tax=Desulfatitalea alkaliphila TaxID=2929485 RepID=A0AA41R615_9BACT|nr:hypothetical protein [Desulfatitalea alkaliphila]MCJ8502431.1 hypothetical protein [Desulfatitalea alkaliphila]